MIKMHRCVLCKLCALLLVLVEAGVKRQMRNENDVSVSAASRQGNAYYALRSCHQILHGNRGEFFSPDYLCSNPALWCNWTVQVPPGNRVQLFLEDLTPEHVCHLKTDQIHLDEFPVAGGESRILERCWRSSVYTSLSNTVHVVQLIRSNPNPPHRGFYGVYQAFGMQETQDLNSDLSEDEQVKVEETKPKDAVTEIGQGSFSNDLDENADVSPVDRVPGSQSQPEGNEVLKVTTGIPRESRRIRGDRKDQELSPHGASPPDDVELVLAPTENPNGVTLQTYTSAMMDHTSHSPDTLALAYTTHSIPTSTGTTPTRPAKKRTWKRKPILALLHTSTTTADVSRNEVTHFSRVTTRGPDTPTKAMIGGMPTAWVEDVGPVSLETAAEESAANEPNSNANKPSTVKGKSLPVQNLRLATESPPSPADCGRASVPTLLYAVCFLLCLLIVLLMLALGVMYRRFHYGTFLPRCQCSSSFTDTDVNNNPNTGNREAGNTSRLPPPPPPLRLDAGAHDLPLLRFSPLTPPDGKLQKDDAL